MILPLLALLTVRQAAPRKIAVVVGISEFSQPKANDRIGFHALRYAHLDAERMAKRLGDLGWETTLIEAKPESTGDPSVTRDGILAAVERVKTNPEDTFLFYFSGHGAQVKGQDYLVAFDSYLQGKAEGGDTVYTPEPESMLAFAKLRAALYSMRARRRLMILDACRNDPSDGKDGQGAGNADQSKAAEVVSATDEGQVSWSVMYSCSSRQRSFEDERMQGGVFTNALLKGLASASSTRADGQIIPGLLDDVVQDEVAAWCAANGRTMTPRSQSVNAAGSIVIGSLKVERGGGAVLLPTRARLVVSTDVSEATMTVDGLASGLTYETEVEAGGTKDATVVVSAPGRESATYRVTLEAGKETPLRADLKVSSAPAAVAARRGDYATLLPWKSATFGEWAFNANFSRDGKTLAMGGGFGVIVAPINDPGHGRQFGSVRGRAALSADGATVYAATGTKGELGLYDVATGTLRVGVGGHADWIQDIVLSPDAQTLVTTSNDHNAVLRDPTTGEARRSLVGHTSSVNAAAFSPDSRTVATASSDHTAILWDVATGKAVRTLKEDDFLDAIAFSAAGLVATAQRQGRVVLWNPATGERMRTFEAGRAVGLAFSPDGATLAVGDTNGNVTLYDAASGTVVRTLSAHSEPASVVRFSPDGSLLLTGSWDKTIQIYRLPG